MAQNALINTAAALLDDYHCGTSKFTKVLSYIASSMCERDKLNSCCLAHDRCYDRHYYENDDSSMTQCDYEFRSCIRKSYRQSEFLCNKILGITHGSFVVWVGSAYRSLFGVNQPEDHGHGRYRRHLAN
ncbi:unnamed protein product [Bursaphelenchus xylophilus]|uniref:(pine wood nematode) hypothetical protein n=1 Tax=Bursaphelenchus xylophilus TaxID=6326 RepID=A0A1I7SV56_BURXY|nr:unnamed protein product [Bursaphelenchus xylophilus]CAG9100926.1 unnamed protein product [Bursaphelenchus xylophilus]